jgi:FdhD protein
VQWRGGERRLRDDAVAWEEPLELRIGAEPLAVLMRTPGHDEELALGLLLGERIVAEARDVESLRHCSVVPAPEAEGNVLRVLLRPGVAVDLERVRRNLYASASCGVCGRATLENALGTLPPLEDETRLPARFFHALPALLRSAQAAFAATGGIHAAGLFDAAGRLLVAREDVGRHNAVDKVIGWAARGGRLPLSGHVLLVSGRISYEIVQKALSARIPVVAAVSAPSSLAVDLAAAGRVALVGFLRGEGLNVYGHAARIV